MITQRHFYFMRHGETDHNKHLILNDEADISLNEKGRQQALSICPAISKLPIQTICVSPLRRALETAENAANQLTCSWVVIEELKECSGDVWSKMVNFESCLAVDLFRQKVKEGINRALDCPGPVLIIAHGGVHWAMCDQMAIQGYEKKIGNCVPVYFNYTSLWKASYL